MRYQIKPIERVEADLADVRICNEYDKLVVTFTLPDIYEAYIARELMIRALAKAVLITSHTSVVREKRNSAEEVITELNRLSSQGNEGAPRLPPPEEIAGRFPISSTSSGLECPALTSAVARDSLAVGGGCWGSCPY